LAKKTSKTPIATRKRAVRAKRPTLGELNDWITANHEALLKKARANCLRLTGKPTFGGTLRTKWA
jgi:hypothetical protein